MNVLTPWFPASVKPARWGPYLTRETELGPVVLRDWDGSSWTSYWSTWTSYWSSGVKVRCTPDLYWQGLAFDPDAALDCGDAETMRAGWWVPQP